MPSVVRWYVNRTIDESPLYDGRAQAVLAEARRLVPGKPIRYVVNSHHHFDHSGGLRAAAAEGITIISSEAAKPYFERTFATPNSINPDALQKSGRKATVMGVASMRDIGTAARPVQVHYIENSVHAQGFNMVWLPRERLLIEADAYTPLAPGAAPSSAASPAPNAARRASSLGRPDEGVNGPARSSPRDTPS